MERNWTDWCRDSSVGIATRYGLDAPDIEFRWGARFSAPVQTGLGAHSASCTMGAGSFPRVKRPERFVDYPPPSRAEVEGRVELYLSFPSGPSWPVLGRTFTGQISKMHGIRSNSRSHYYRKLIIAATYYRRRDYKPVLSKQNYQQLAAKNTNTRQEKVK